MQLIIQGEKRPYLNLIKRGTGFMIDVKDILLLMLTLLEMQKYCCSKQER
jgi:hypothetical protein